MIKQSKVLFWWAIPTIAFVYLVSRLYPVLPAVMQDEYVYSSESRHMDFSEQAFPNYLFSMVYKSTSMCGNDFYSCAKNLNILFFLVLLVFVYLIASRLLGRGYAIAAVTLTILSPVGESISFFMPETMYFTFMVATIWFALKAAQKHQRQWWLYTGLMLGLTTLVKPHGLFALPVLALFALFISIRISHGSWAKGAVNATIVLASTVFVKFALGFAFAGTKGLSLFGQGYTDSVQQFVNTSTTGGTVTTNSGAGVSETVTASAAELFASTMTLQLLMHSSMLLFVWGVPAFLALSVLKNVIFKKDEVSELGAFVSLAGALTLTYAVAIAGFEGLVTALGDDHSRRVITRYYDFLIPILVVLVFAIQKYVEPKPWVRIVQSVFVVAALVWVVTYFPGNVDTKVADSIPLMGLFYAPAVAIVVAVIVFGAQVFWLIKPERGAKAISMVIAPLLILIIGISAQASLIQKIGTQKAYFDLAGQTSAPYLKDVEGKDILVVGTSRPEVFTSKFWIDKANIRDYLVGPDGNINMSALQGYKYALFLGTNEIGIGEAVTSGDKFVLVKLSN